MDPKEYIVSEYMWLVKKIAKTFNNIEQEDLYQAGKEGLLKAFMNYDENSEAKFSTYAYKYVYGAMHQLIYKTSDLKISRDVLTKYKLILHTQQQLTQVYLKEPSYQDIANIVQMSEEEIGLIIQAVQKMASMDTAIGEDLRLEEVIACKEDISLDDKILLEESINELDELQKRIIDCRYYQGFTQSETAQILGLSQVKVSRYEQKSLQRMKTFVGS